MGRVYNALVKADRLTDPQRPIGRVGSDDRTTPRQDSAAVRRQNDSAVDATAPPRRNTLPHRTFDFDDKTQGATFDHTFDHASGAAPADFDSLFALSETTGARARVEPLLPPAQPTFAAAPPAALTIDRATAPPTAPAVFAEPHQFIDVRSLTIVPQIAAITGADQLAAERYRTLAVRISTLASRRKIKSIVITSAEAGEGKSTVAVNLAWTLARRGERRVLLLDANPRATSINRLLGTRLAHGWLELGDAHTDLSDTLVRLDPNGLYVMTARGAEATDTADGGLDDALMSSRFEKRLAALAEQFDLILIDAPAICDSADAQQLAAIADGCVLVARAGRTPHRRVSEATDMIPQERRLGVVLNDCGAVEASPRRSSKRSLMGRLFRR